MKRLTLLIFAGCLLMSFSAVAQTTEYTHSITDVSNFASISNETNKMMPLKASLKVLEKQYNATFIYKSYLVEGKTVPQKVIKAKDFQTAFAELLNYAHLTYDRIGKRSFLLSAATEQLANDVVQETVSGTVTDAQTGDPLPGVNILVVGTSTGAATNNKGHYSVNVPSLQDTLRFSFIGYQQQTVPIGGKTTINVALKPTVFSGQQMVVTALGITRQKRSLGYSTQQVKGSNLALTSSDNSTLASLSGKISGVKISGSSGASLGGTETIKIRGVNSLSGQGQPLIVVDGTPISNQNFSGSSGADYGNLARDINPNNIKSVNVLKGPAASSLYGIRGQFGVILITTKSGSRNANGITVELNSSFSAQIASNFFPRQNKYGQGASQTWRTLDNGEKYVDFIYDESWGPKMDGTMVRQFYSMYPEDNEYGKLTPFKAHPNNYRSFFNTGLTSNQDISVSGGKKKYNYYVSFKDTRNKGVEPNTHLRSDKLNVNSNINITDNLIFSTNISFITNSGLRPPQGYGSAGFVPWTPPNVNVKRLKNYKYNDGQVVNWNIRRPDESTGKIANLKSLYWVNPYFEAYQNLNPDNRTRIFGNVKLKYNILPHLEIKGRISGDTYTQNISHRILRRYGDYTPSYSIGKYQNTEMNYKFTAEYKRSFSNFSLQATVGTKSYDRNYNYLSEATEGGLTAPGYYNIKASIDRPSTSSYKLRKKIYSLFGLVSLGLNNTYYLDLSIRNDKSSALPRKNDSYVYPSISGSFIFSNLLNFKPLSLGKLRLSYAQAGSDLNPYQTSFFYDVGTPYNELNTLTIPNSIINTNLKPSYSNSYEAGIDLKFINRIGLHVTYYLQKNRDEILPLVISGTSGYGSTTINAGLIQNKGIEINISGTPIENHNFNWYTSLNWSRNRNKVIKLYPGVNVYQLGSTTFSSVPSYLKSFVGKSFGDLVGQAYKRDPKTRKILLDENNLPEWTSATHNFGTVLPNFTGGFQNRFNYKQFSLSAMIDYQMGGKFFSRGKMIMVRTGVDPITVGKNARGKPKRAPVSQGGGVRVEGESAKTGESITAYVNARDYYNLTIGRKVYEDWVFSKSYVKLSNVNITYHFSNNILKNTMISNLSIGLFAKDPIMIWQAAPKGLDPSELTSGSQQITWYENHQLNTVRSYGVNVKIKF
jgi:TonB-linked SusC/RagA family outer membrane protein